MRTHVSSIVFSRAPGPTLLRSMAVSLVARCAICVALRGVGGVGGVGCVHGTMRCASAWSLGCGRAGPRQPAHNLCLNTTRARAHRHIHCHRLRPPKGSCRPLRPASLRLESTALVVASPPPFLSSLSVQTLQLMITSPSSLSDLISAVCRMLVAFFDSRACPQRGRALTVSKQPRSNACASVCQRMHIMPGHRWCLAKRKPHWRARARARAWYVHRAHLLTKHKASDGRQRCCDVGEHALHAPSKHGRARSGRTNHGPALVRHAYGA